MSHYKAFDYKPRDIAKFNISQKPHISLAITEMLF